jgi:predicted phosphoribosyltransferase
VPVAPTSTLRELQQEADGVVLLEHHSHFGSVGEYYADFDQVSDEVVVEILKSFPAS